MSNFSKTLLKFGMIILLINAVGMWIFFYLDHKNLLELQKLNNTPATTSQATEKTNQNNLDLDKRVDLLEGYQAQLVGRMDDLESSVAAIQARPTTTTVRSTSISTPKALKEYTIYLGEGSTLSRDWTTIQATTISIDTNKYPGLSAVYFEAALSTNGGEVYAQLIDADSGAIISSPALVNNTPSPTWKSIKVNLENSGHTYVVQLRSSSGETVTLSGSRLRIMAN